jgi:hypothetical protein
MSKIQNTPKGSVLGLTYIERPLHRFLEKMLSEKLAMFVASTHLTSERPHLEQSKALQIASLAIYPPDCIH